MGLACNLRVSIPSVKTNMKNPLSICLLAVVSGFLASAPLQAATLTASKPAVSKTAVKKKHQHKGKKHKKHKGV